MTTVFCFAQDTTKKVNYTKDDSTIHNPVLRLAIGAQRAAYAEVGLGLHSSAYGNGQLYTEYGFYGAFEVTPTILSINNKNLYGFKVGFEKNSIVSIGFEAKYLTDGTLSQRVLTPKLGVSPKKFIHFYLGFNIPINNYNPFSGIDPFQFSLLFEIHRKKYRKTHARPDLDVLIKGY